MDSREVDRMEVQTLIDIVSLSDTMEFIPSEKTKELLQDKRMTIKDAEGLLALPFGLDEAEEKEAIDVIKKALTEGYTLCKVDEAIEKMEDFEEQIFDTEGQSEVWAVVYRCVDILKEACEWHER